jgi:NADH-quinone oxidoreductase subunit M
VLVFAETLLLWSRFNPGSGEFQFVERHEWIPAFGISYFVGVDGISLLLLVLTGFLTPLALLSSWESVHRKTRAFCIVVLLLESAMMGVFVSLDLFLFYVFWDAMLVPMYFLIGIWGYDRRIYAAVKFILYTMAGSVLMLLAILGLAYLHYTSAGTYSFDLLKLYEMPLTPHQQFWFFLAFALAYVIKVPVFPFHTWLPDAHVEAPTAGSVILAGVLLKMGTYGFLRFSLALFPQAAVDLAPLLLVLGTIGIIYGAIVATMQPNLKRLVAYSSVAHLGFVVVGIFALTTQGLEGGIFTMISHGLTTGALFLLVGMLYDRRHTYELSEYNGLWNIGDRTAVSASGWVEPYEGGSRYLTVGAALGRPDGTQFYTGYRQIDPLNSKAVTAAVSYQLSRRYAVGLTTTYDFGTNTALSNSVNFVRVGTDLTVTLSPQQDTGGGGGLRTWNVCDRSSRFV